MAAVRACSAPSLEAKVFTRLSYVARVRIPNFSQEHFGRALVQLESSMIVMSGVDGHAGSGALF